ncbi:MAG: tetratricopeptide repeat protein [Nitrospirae bacterium]|nr:tetratricopeptide repeat protein [Magnetococcales bacterium]
MTVDRGKAFALYAQGDPQEALRVANAIMVATHPDASLLNLAALCHMQLGNADLAQSCWRQAIQISPEYIDAWFNLGNLYHALGHGKQAEEAFRHILRIQPDHAQTHNNLGIVLNQQGQLEHAEASLRRALHLKADYAEAHNNLGVVLNRQNRFEEAQNAFRLAVHHNPMYAEAYDNIGHLLVLLKRYEPAELAFMEVLRIHPNHAEATNNLGSVLLTLNRLDEAEAVFHRAISLKPNFFQAFFNLGNLSKEKKQFEAAEIIYRHVLSLKPDYAEALNNLGIVLNEQKRLDEAEAAYRQALSINPDYAQAWCNLGMVLKGQRRFTEAEAAFHKALELEPDAAGTHNNLGVLLTECQRCEEAEASFRHALHMKPDHAAAASNLGHLLKEMNRFAEAEAAYRLALSIEPCYHDAHWDLGLLFLSLGRYEEGWSSYEIRHEANRKDHHAPYVKAHFPMWCGEELTGKSLLIIPEQGFGDQIQFCRYAALLKAKGVTHLTLMCGAPLMTLFRSVSGVDQWVEEQTDAFPAHDFWTLYLSLPHHLGTTLASIPQSIPYLSPPSDHLTRWRLKIPPGGLRVGLVWKGNPGHKNDHNRSLPDLSVLAPLWSLSGVVFISLQRGSGEEEAQNPPANQPLLDYGPSIVDFADTAALIAHLDLVISIDSAVAHLAGAMGKPCWVLLPAWGTDWRWLLNRTDSPWYPVGMRLFRQDRPGDWSTPVQRMAQELALFCVM